MQIRLDGFPEIALTGVRPHLVLMLSAGVTPAAGAGRAAPYWILPAEARLLQIFICEIPVDQVPPRVDVLRPRVAIVDVVRMLPHVAGDYRRLSLPDRASCVMGRDDLDRAVLGAHQPCPSAAEVTVGDLAELFLERVETAERFLDRIGDRPLGLA